MGAEHKLAGLEKFLKSMSDAMDGSCTVRFRLDKDMTIHEFHLEACPTVKDESGRVLGRLRQAKR